jgi:hypothetical protein
MRGAYIFATIRLGRRRISHVDKSRRKEDRLGGFRCTWTLRVGFPSPTLVSEEGCSCGITSRWGKGGWGSTLGPGKFVPLLL